MNPIDIKPGDNVTRSIDGNPMMKLIVTSVGSDLIHCGAWAFDRRTGAEVDEELGWCAGGTGTYLSHCNEKELVL